MKDFQLIKYIKTALLFLKIYHSQVRPGNLFFYEIRILELAKQLKSVNKLEISVFWHPLISFDKNFPQNAEKLWEAR